MGGGAEGEKSNIIKIPHNFILPTSEKRGEIPDGFAFTGGTFRSYAQEWLGLAYTPIRDLDLIALEHHNPNSDKIHQVSSEFMEDDYSYGNGVKIEKTNENLVTRDFTINEGYINQTHIYTTKEALCDLLDGVIKPTEYELNTHNTYRQSMRALKFFSDLSLIRNDVMMEGIDINIFQEILDNEPFLIALFLQKTAEQDEKSLYHSFEILKKFINITDNLYDFMKNLSEETNFEFRGKAKLMMEELIKNEFYFNNYGDLTDSLKDQQLKEKNYKKFG